MSELEKASTTRNAERGTRNGSSCSSIPVANIQRSTSAVSPSPLCASAPLRETPTARPSDRPTVQPSNRARRAAFTLFELMVVITIIIFISVVILVNYFGATRSTAYAAATNDVYDALMLARQRACLDGARTYLRLMDSTNYTLFRAVGSVTQMGVGYFDDVYSDLSSFGTYTGVIVNMTRDDSSAIVSSSGAQDGRVFPPIPGQEAGYPVTTYRLTAVSSGTWKTNDIFGIELHARQRLPKGFCFSEDPDSANPLTSSRNVIFQPDGTVDMAGVTEFAVVEEIRAGKSANRVKFKILANGTIQRIKLRIM